MNEPARCRFDRERAEYITPDGETCDVPKRDHCTARKTCPQHLAWGELTCARCLGRTRQDIRQIVERAALMLPEAMVVGVNSEAAALAGPACDPEAWSWRKVAAKQGRSWHVSLDEDDDETDPERVLTTWAQMLSEDYDLDRPERWTISNAAAFLDRIVGRVAQDENQDFALFRREIAKCRSHADAVLRDSMSPERGAPCPTCLAAGIFVRLIREYSHWCTDPECQQFHLMTDEADVWRCPIKSEHWWNPQGYADVLEERKGA